MTLNQLKLRRAFKEQEYSIFINEEWKQVFVTNHNNLIRAYDELADICYQELGYEAATYAAPSTVNPVKTTPRRLKMNTYTPNPVRTPKAESK